MRKQCKIIEDLLPLYHDGVCSEESRQMVEAHLSKCEECRKLLAQIDDDIIFPAKDEDVEVLKGISKAVRRGKNKALLAGILISLAVILVSFAGISACWYFYEYNYYLAFADGQTLSSEANIKNEINPTQTYVDVRLERKQSVLQTYHKALQPKTTVTGKEAGQETSKKAKKKSSEMEL